MRALLALLLLVLAWPAQAEPEANWRTIRKEFRICHWDGCRIEHRDVRVRDYRPRVYAYERRVEDERWEERDPNIERGVSCKPDLVRVVGGAHLTKEGAINDAVRQWQSTVRYDYGEKFMDVESARQYRWRCDRASTNETLAGKVGEYVTGGQGFQRRCVVLARPCMQPVQRGDEDKR